MKRLRTSIALGILTLVLRPVPAWPDERLRFPEDVPVDIYYSAPIGFLNDGEWVTIPFWRPLESVRADFNLLDFVDPQAIGLPLLVEGFARFREGDHPVSWEARGLGAVPFVFVPLSELLPAIADEELTIVELLSLPSLRVGAASFYQEQNHIFNFHPVSHYTMVALGTLADGRSFVVRFVEVDLVLLQAEIGFK